MVGLGKWAEVIARGIDQTPEIELAACFTRTPEKRASFAERYNCDAVESYEALLAHPDVEAVAILSSTQVHGDQAFAAIEAGKHLFMEKPITPTIQEGFEIVRRCEEAGLVMQMGYETRCMAGLQHMKKLLKEGKLGQPVMCEVNWSHDLGLRLTPDNWHYYEANVPGGPIMQLGIHHVCNALILMGPVVRVKAIGARRLITAEVPDLTGAILEHESGGLTYVGCYYHCPRRFHVNLLCTEASVLLNLRLLQGDVVEYLNKLLEADAYTDLEIRWRDQEAPEIVDLSRGNIIVEEVKEFAEQVRNGGAQEADGRRGVETLAIVLAAVESMKTGQTIEMKDYLAAHGA
jgi:predicted dehydrogenase